MKYFFALAWAVILLGLTLTALEWAHVWRLL